MSFEGIIDILRNLGAFSKQAWFSGRPRWTPAQMQDLAGKVVIVTGGSSGIGKEIVKARRSTRFLCTLKLNGLAQELLLHNAKVYLAARNPEKTERVIKELTETTGKTAVFLELDLGDLKSVKAAAEVFLSCVSPCLLPLRISHVCVTTGKRRPLISYSIMGKIYALCADHPTIIIVSQRRDAGSKRHGHCPRPRLPFRR